MNPFQLLRLWRERWGMAGSQALTAEYIPPAEQSWEWRLAHADAWSLRGLPILAGTVGLLLLLPAAVIVYAPAAQVLIGLAMFGVALYVRRYTGLLPFMVLSGLATGASWLCYFRALKLGDAARVAPLDKLSVVLVAVFGALFLGERLSGTNWAGVALIATGAVLVAWRG